MSEIISMMQNDNRYELEECSALSHPTRIEGQPSHVFINYRWVPVDEYKEDLEPVTWTVLAECDDPQIDIARDFYWNCNMDDGSDEEDYSEDEVEEEVEEESIEEVKEGPEEEVKEEGSKKRKKHKA